MREVVGVVLSLHNVPDQDISTYAMFSFMYGLLPPAPGVFVYATGYALDVDLVSYYNLKLSPLTKINNYHFGDYPMS